MIYNNIIKRYEYFYLINNNLIKFIFKLLLISIISPIILIKLITLIKHRNYI